MTPVSQASGAGSEEDLLLPKSPTESSQFSGKRHCVSMTAKCVACHSILIILALFLVLGGLLLLPFVMSEIYKYVIDKMMVLDPSSPLFSEWVTPNIPMFQSYYFFDIQNPEEFKAGAKPVVKERGPYVYRLAYDRLNLTFYDNGTLSHRPMYYYYFDEEKSVGPDTDSMMVLNMPLVTVAYFVRNSGFVVQSLANALMNRLGERLAVNLTVRELLWGYDEPLFELIQDIIPIPGFDQGKFGFLIGFNATTDHLFTVFTGKENQSMLNVVNNYQGEPLLPWWWSEETNTIRGTDGTMYHPYRTREEDIYLFHPDLCRSVRYLYHNDTVYKKVPLLKYVLAPYTYDNGTSYPPNAGFCSGDKDLCGPSGVMRQDPCRYGSPSAISNPHFFEGDPMLREAVIGLHPQASLHQHYMEVEPLMGMPYVLKMRLQINMKLEPVAHLTEVKKVPDMMFPVLWFEQSVEADDRIVGYYEKGFVLTSYIAFIIEWLMFSIGIVVFVASVISFGRRIAYPKTVPEEEKNAKVINAALENGSYIPEA
ncbi:scavenger receptor class B member 1-like [Diadema antillarum]|uniref:scavenger receptor class B member 1-like n=1 Tax=Diadema antillarum TaxID=105358 RepID=UPI003A870D1D